MTRLFTTGAEAGSTEIFSTVGAGVTASTARQRTGAYSFLFSGGSTGVASITLSADKTSLYFRMGLYLTGSGVSGSATYCSLIHLRDNAAGDQICLCFNRTTYTLHVIRGTWSGTILGTSVNTIPLNAWCCIEWYVKIDDGVAGASTVKMDGFPEITIPAADTKATAVAGARTVVLGWVASGGSSTGLAGNIDDLAINDDAGAVNNSWIGRGGVVPLLLTGPGTYTDLHASEGDPFECINEVPASDTDYVYDAVVNQKSTFALTNLVPTTGNIACIVTNLRAAASLAASRNVARLLRSNGVDGQGADVGIDVSYKTIVETIETDPGTPGGTGAWTIDRVNALEAGMVVR